MLLSSHCNLKAWFAVVVTAFISTSSVLAQVDPSSRILTADSACPRGQDFCLTALYDASNQAINYTLITAGNPTGWRSVGQGEGMRNANMLVAWAANGQPVLSHRSAAGERMPTEELAQGTFTPQTDVSRVLSSMAVFSWTFPQPAGPGNAFVHIWAANTRTTPSGGASGPFSIHDEHGGFALDLTKAYNGEAPAVPSGVAALTDFKGTTTQTTSNTNAGGGGADSQARVPMRDLNVYHNRIWIAHMVFMLLAWLCLVPAAILVARYGRTFFTWLPTHRGLQIAAFLSVTIGFFLAVGALVDAGAKHFSARHMKVGLAIYILMFFQLVLGQFGHVIRRKTGSRLVNFVHIPLGLLIYALAIWNCHLGFKIWSWWQVPDSATWVVAAWSILVAVVYIAGLLLVPKERRLESSNEKPGQHQGV